ncbi:helix-turn-helix transcriptional regulator [Castellaniella sp.]|uniref:helix-turn-helix transcriptional regulator n=1 Tax=Castellaniella sp. TaxID=1955812 RepID=UPI0035681529
MGADAQRRKALGAFLRNARARLQPADHGLPAGTRRRTPGLRREELAQLSDISLTWYTWIEQGRPVSVSAEVWCRLADVLSLSHAERHYLFNLAGATDPRARSSHPATLPEGLDDCVHSIRAAAYILDQCWNILACNAALRDVFCGWPGDAPANLLRYIFLDPAAPARIVHWETRARRVVAEFRADIASVVDTPEIQSLVAELQAASPAFARFWNGQAVTEREGGWRAFEHPARGRLMLRQFTFRLAVRPDCKLVILLDGPNPAPDCSTLGRI